MTLQFQLVFSCIVLMSVSSLGSLLIPQSAGPLYGIPFNTKAAARLLIPSTATGKCQAGKSYTISDSLELRRYQSELQCIFSTGLTPTKVPEGPQYGRVLLALNSRHPIINPIVSLIWRGNFAIKARCNSSHDDAPPGTSVYARRYSNSNRNSSDTEVYIGFHNILGQATLPCLMYVGPLGGEFAPGEHEDGRPSGILDFSKDLTKICGGWNSFYASQLGNASFPVNRQRLSNTNFFPQTQIYDVFRLVGVQQDGGKIYLGKTYFRDHYQKDQQLATIAFWYMVNYDKEVNPDFQRGQSLPPVETDFQYIFPGIADFLMRFLPFDNLIRTPLRSSFRLGSGLARTSRTAWLNLREFRSQVGSRRASRRKLRQYWRNGRRQRILGFGDNY